MRSNPVPPREEWDPIQAEESLTAAFMNTALSGRWILRLRDTTVKEIATGIGRAAVRDEHGEGGVSGWEVNAPYYISPQIELYYVLWSTNRPRRLYGWWW